MQRGQLVLRDLDLRVIDLRQQAKVLSDELASRVAERDALQKKLAETTHRLAQARLGWLDQADNADSTDAVDRHAIDLLRQRDEALSSLEQAIADSARRQQQCAERREQCLAVVDAVAWRASQAEHRACEELSKTDAYQALEEQCQRAEEVARLARDKARTATEDRETKRKPYESDKLFMYLWQRRFGFPEYQANALTRSIDQWVAQLIGYDGAHRNYRMLLALADHLANHAKTQAEAAEDALRRQVDAEDEALRVAGLPALEEELGAAEDALAQAEQAIEEEEGRHRQQLDERAAIAAGTDRFTRAALEALGAQIERDEAARLRQEAQATTPAEDDALVVVLSDLRPRLEAMQAEVDRLQQRNGPLLKQLQDAEALRARFRAQSYDSSHSEFEDGFAIGAVLDRMLRGVIEVDAAWEEIRRQQRTRLPPVARSPGGGGGGYGGSRPRGGFGSGGGFRTGGGFRGGGGFRTGGSF